MENYRLLAYLTTCQSRRFSAEENCFSGESSASRCGGRVERMRQEDYLLMRREEALRVTWGSRWNFYFPSGAMPQCVGAKGGRLKLVSGAWGNNAESFRWNVITRTISSRPVLQFLWQSRRTSSDRNEEEGDTVLCLRRSGINNKKKERGTFDLGKVRETGDGLKRRRTKKKLNKKEEQKRTEHSNNINQSGEPIFENIIWSPLEKDKSKAKGRRVESSEEELFWGGNRKRVKGGRDKSKKLNSNLPYHDCLSSTEFFIISNIREHRVLIFLFTQEEQIVCVKR